MFMRGIAKGKQALLSRLAGLFTYKWVRFYSLIDYFLLSLNPRLSFHCTAQSTSNCIQDAGETCLWASLSLTGLVLPKYAEPPMFAMS
jgi:hypothetical protein